MRALAVLVLLYVPVWGQICAPTARLQPVDTVEGTITPSNCRLSDGTYFASYSLTLPTQGVVRLTLEAENLPATLIVRDAIGRRAASGAGVTQTLERGEYTVLVNSDLPDQTGVFVGSLICHALGVLVRAFVR